MRHNVVTARLKGQCWQLFITLLHLGYRASVTVCKPCNSVQTMLQGFSSYSVQTMLQGFSSYSVQIMLQGFSSYSVQTMLQGFSSYSVQIML